MSAALNDTANQADVADAPGTALAVIPASAVSTIIAADKDGILAAIAARVAAFRPDVSTKRGRDEMRSLAADIATAKVALIKTGKGLTEQWRKSTAAVNAECNIIEDRMNELRDKVRAPLTEFENREKSRIAAHEAVLAGIPESPMFFVSADAAELQQRLTWLTEFPARDWQEFADRAADALASEIAKTTNALSAALRREAEAAELAKLRAEAEARRIEDEVRARAERDRRLQAEAAENARLAAEAEAQRLLAEQRCEAARREREAAEALDRAEREKREAEERVAQAERDRIAAQEQAARDAKAEAERVERDRLEALEQAKRDQDAAIEAERRRVEAIRSQTEKEERERAENRAHRSGIMRAAKEALMHYTDIDEETATRCIKAIAAGSVNHISIRF